MRRPVTGLALVALVAAGCAGDQVALNERIFAASTMQSEGSGCGLYVLGSGDQASASTGALGLTVTQDLSGARVIVSVTEADRTLVTRFYDGAFFQSGTLDEFTATASSGDALLLRYWGRWHPDGLAGCAPSSDDGSR